MPDAANHYDVLGVPITADADTIKRAYYAKIRQFHPDRFMAERTRLEASKDQAGLRTLEQRLENAQRQTQRLNAAYAILGDPESRARYDRQRMTARPADVVQAARRNPDFNFPRDYEPRTSHTQRRPHTRPGAPSRTPNPDRFPAILAGVFFVFLVGAAIIVSNFFRPVRTSTVLPSTQTLLFVPVGSTDATARARQKPPTPRSVESYTLSGDRLYEAGLYGQAIDQYTAAIQQDLSDATLYYRRGRAHAANASHQAALADFARTLKLDKALSVVHRERGLLYFRLWQEYQRPADAEAARTNLEYYLTTITAVAPDAVVMDALAALP